MNLNTLRAPTPGKLSQEANAARVDSPEQPQGKLLADAPAAMGTNAARPKPWKPTFKEFIYSLRDAENTPSQP